MAALSSCVRIIEVGARDGIIAELRAAAGSHVETDAGLVAQER